ncbi:MFS transporter [Chitinilyticum aquatile]|uniref:MFS transporter n=1 Tax=Chitinilyticum aquatile TaxID=362520 RepID=UPI0004110C77|nr:MFS transporter [Chitinilyticum aquatile]
MHQPNQFDLFRTRRFLPLFITQFFGAFNDNLFKNALLVLITFHGLAAAGMDAQTLVNAAAGIFILPFFLFSTFAGQLAEKYDKAVLARAVKILEIIIMALAGIGFVWHIASLLMACLFLMGVHSALFGPLKYSILPQYLRDDELLGGNGMIEMGTFVAILLGQISGTLLIQHEHGEYLIVAACLGVALLGWLASRSMPAAPPTAPNLRLNWNIASETWHIIRHSCRNKAVFNSILGISWFWFFGAVYLTQLPDLAKSVLHGDPGVYTLLMTIFSVGVGAGSALCEKLSGRKVEVGLVPLGSLGLSLFGIDLYFALNSLPASTTVWTPLNFIAAAGHWRVMLDLLLMGVAGGLFIVPLYALVQTRTEKEFTSRAIAANNILNSLFMVVAAGMSIVLLGAGLTVPELLLTVTILNVLVAIYIYTLIPEFILRFLVWLLVNTLYRVREQDLHHIPDQGAALLVCNHVSYMDALVIAGSVRRPVRFVMDHRIYRLPVLHFIFRLAGAIPIAPEREDAGIKEDAFQQIAAALRAGELVCLFPEGHITRSGKLARFQPGTDRILRDTPVPVVPLALQGLWGSFFSRKDGSAMLKWPRRFRARIALRAGEALLATSADRLTLEKRIATLLAQA